MLAATRLLMALAVALLGVQAVAVGARVALDALLLVHVVNKVAHFLENFSARATEEPLALARGLLVEVVDRNVVLVLHGLAQEVLGLEFERLSVPQLEM